jgi:hypothetical protein
MEADGQETFGAFDNSGEQRRGRSEQEVKSG